MTNDQSASESSGPEIPEEQKTLQASIGKLLNKFSAENDSNTPDFILARYLIKCLETWNECVTLREIWYGRSPEPGTGITPLIGPVNIHTEEAPLPPHPFNFGSFAVVRTEIPPEGSFDIKS